jgi:hypothetical protein
MRIFLCFAVLLFIAAAPAQAQDMLSSERNKDPTTKLLEDPANKPVTVEDYANIYYQTCVKADPEPSMADYNQTQCACTAAQIPKFMTLSDVQSLFEEGPAGERQQGRLMASAYIPCLYYSIYNVVYDGCFYDDKSRKSMKYPKKVCGCYAQAMGSYVANSGRNLVPGFTRVGYNSKKSVPNPVSYIVGADFFARTGRTEFRKCFLVEERGLGK